MTAQMVLHVSGWLVAAVVAAVVAVLFALAWWSSGRARPLSGSRRDMSQAEKDYLAEQGGRRTGLSGGDNLGGFGS